MNTYYPFIIQVSYGSPTTKLSDSVMYPSIVRTIPTFDSIFEALAQLFREFEWEQVMLITEEINFSAQVHLVQLQLWFIIMMI